MLSIKGKRRKAGGEGQLTGPESVRAFAELADYVATTPTETSLVLLVSGASPEEAAGQIGTVEGLTTAPVLRDLSRKVGVEMPITGAVCDILEGASLDDLIAGLMGRRPTAE